MRSIVVLDLSTQPYRTKFTKAKMTTPSVWGMQTIVLAERHGLITLARIIIDHRAGHQGRAHPGVLHTIAHLHAMGSRLTRHFRLVRVPTEYIGRLQIVATHEGERLDWTGIEDGWDRCLTERELHELIAEAGAAHRARQLRRRQFITATGDDLVELVRTHRHAIAPCQRLCLLDAIQRSHPLVLRDT